VGIGELLSVFSDSGSARRPAARRTGKAPGPIRALNDAWNMFHSAKTIWAEEWWLRPRGYGSVRGERPLPVGGLAFSTATPERPPFEPLSFDGHGREEDAACPGGHPADGADPGPVDCPRRLGEFGKGTAAPRGAPNKARLAGACLRGNRGSAARAHGW